MNTSLFQVSPTILIFDSGVGGLSIYNKIRRFLPDLHFIYAFDNFAFPYGEKKENFITKRVLKIIDAIYHIYPLSLVIIACNTASIVSLSILRKKFTFPIIGALPAIKSAISLTKNKMIGVIATKITIRYLCSLEFIKQFSKTYQIKMISSSDLVKLAEDKLHGRIIKTEILNRIFYSWLKMSVLPDTIVLGCTHFPFLKEELLALFPKEIKFVDSSLDIAKSVSKIFAHKIKDVKSSKENIAYCMVMNSKIEQLLPTLRHFGFKMIKKLEL